MRSCFLLLVVILLSPVQSFSQNKKKPKDYRVAASVDPLFSIPFDGKYVGYFSSEEYRDAFYEEFLEHLNYKETTFVSKKDTTAIPGRDFLIYVRKVSFQEYLHHETVNDPSDGCKRLEYVSCYSIVEFDVRYLPAETEVKSTKIEVTRDEKVTNRRTIFDMIFKVPEDQVRYRVNELSDSVFMDMCKRSARKSANKAIRIIEREVKRLRNGDS